MKMPSALLALSLLIPAGAAQAQVQAPAQAQPQVHVQVLRAPAPPNGDNVVVIAVNDVRVPATLPGQCLARGVVTQVVSGSQFHAGQSLAIKVACGQGRTSVCDGQQRRDEGAGHSLERSRAAASTESLLWSIP